jgi:sterol desaturase/sphingolipid hydroxylase (fatty acid hydroxylase superfamily)
VSVGPINHRVHHGQDDHCIDRNYGGILVVWDRLFGTLADERDGPITSGARTPLRSVNALRGNLHHALAGASWLVVGSAAAAPVAGQKLFDRVA